jgi:hypothetical protein
MKGVSPTTPFAIGELLSRYILFNLWYRTNGTVKQDAFIPYPNQDLSVTRQEGLTNSDLWQIGLEVAKNRNKPLFGRADFKVDVLFEINPPLQPVSTPPPPINHVNITGWPADKSEQKVIALQIAAKAEFVRNP